MSTFTVKPTNGDEPFDVEADRVEYDRQTGATVFFEGENIVARLLNVSFQKKAEKSAPSSGQ